MSCGERLPPPPGFGAAAAGRRPLRGDFRGTMSATNTSTMAIIKTESDVGSLEVVQQSQMRNEVMASQSSSQGNSSLDGNKNVSPAKGPYKRVHADATKVASPGVNASNTGQHLRPRKKSKGLEEHDKLEDNEGASESKRPPTPINLFEDECVFCHSFRTSEFHGPMVMYRKGIIVSSNEGNPNNVIYVHQKCMDWAPNVYHDGDIIVNMENEMERAKKNTCSRCKLPGAALGCYNESCKINYHPTCAVMILECDWDDNWHVLCPKHSSNPLPCDKKSSEIVKSDIFLPISQNQCLDKQGMHVVHSREDQQVDQLNNSTSSLLQGQCSDKEGRSPDYWREEKQTNQSRTLVNHWVLLGSVLSASEKDSLKEFASLTGSNLAEKWDKNVTHVIVGRSASESCGISYEVMMAILCGKWVVRAEWIVDFLAEPIPGPKTCLAEPITVPEISYEVEFYYASHTVIDGPKKGRDGAAKGAPKLFSGLHFCLSTYINQEVREDIKNLIAAAEGQVLEAMSLRSLQENLEKDPAKVYFIYFGGPPRDDASTLSVGMEEEVKEYMSSGAQMICHLWLFDAIVAFDVRMLDRSDGFTPDMYALPCDKESSQIINSDIILPNLQTQCLDKQGMHVIHGRADQPNILASSLPQGHCSDKGGLSADYWREEKQTNQSRTPVNQWILLGSVLSASEEDSLKEFASLTVSNLAEKWDKNVTHVIVGTSAGISCGRSYEVLMAILSGKWVVRAEWVVDCLAEPIPGPKTCLAEPITLTEISYEVQFFYAAHTSIDGPKKGRAGAAKGAPKLFSGLRFCLSVYMNQEVRDNIKKIIVAAEGHVLEAMSPRSLQENLERDPVRVYFIYEGGPPRDETSTLSIGKEKEEYVGLGAQVICHLWLFDAIAAYDVRMLDRSNGLTPDMYAETAW